MCGINGLFSTGAPLPSNVGDLIKQMNQAIAHRGPDDHGVMVDHESGIALGHQRLSIIDLSPLGHQPMTDDFQNSIVFNGEIYNYKKLRSNISNFPYRTESDTEVLLALLQENGIEALNVLNGMFAFGWHDKNKNRLTLVRDRAGKKPLYYCEANGILAFSSEIKALLTLPWMKAVPDYTAVYNFLTFNQLDAPQTMFKDIFKLAPAEYLIADRSGIQKKESWWNVQYIPSVNTNEAQLSEIIYNTFEDAVANRMVADVPVGAFLSGGVDSSAVVAMMRQQTDSVIKTYSVGFGDQPDYDERKYAEQVSKLFQTEHHEKVVSADEIASFLPLIAGIFDEPLADATSIPIYFISKLARENGTIVVQTGDGADELFAGYRNYQKYSKAYPWFHTFSSLPASLKKSAKLVTAFMDEESPVSELIHRGIENQELFWGGAKAFKESSKKSFLSPEFIEKTLSQNSYSVIAHHRKQFEILKSKFPALNDVDWMCYLGFKFQIPNKYLYRMDRLGMANSIEIRSPFLDVNMINLALSVDSKYKIHNGEPKYILKKSFEKILPKEILYRKKMGFCVPLREWAGDIMTGYIESHAKEFCSNTGIFNEAGLLSQISESKKGNKNVTNNLWTVFFLMAWFKKWIP